MLREGGEGKQMIEPGRPLIKSNDDLFHILGNFLTSNR
jgi:hypothetical protein